MTSSDDITHFGAQTIPLFEKQTRVNDVFHQVADRYDLMNDLLSLGMHRCWKSYLVSKLRVPASRPFRHLDVAGGTGDIALAILEAGGPATHVTLLDINSDMLRVGQERERIFQQTKGLDRTPLQFIDANAEELPFPDHSFDAYTIAFGLRNVPRIEKALQEAHRVLKRGGHFLCLEFSKVDVPGLACLYKAYSFGVIPMLGKLIVGDAAPYEYLVESIERFKSPEELEELLRIAGFLHTHVTRMSGGIVAIHSAWKGGG